MESLGPRAVRCFMVNLSKAGRHHQRRLPRRSRHRLPLLRRCLLFFSHSFPRIGLPPQAIVNEAACTGCGECVGACPGEAITLGAARSGDVS